MKSKCDLECNNTYILTYTKLIFLLGATLSLMSCQWQNETKSSVIVIAVDSLSTELVTCLDESETSNSGFAALCSESIRFTHAYTTSLLSAPALSSILTAQYPYETRLLNNGSNSLSNEIKTVAESALEKGYHTSFYSGGPPVFRRLGFAQGFEVFDDNTPVNLSEIYRPISQSLDLLSQWIEKDVKSKSFFSVIFASDLQFPNFSTKNNVGEQRATTLRGQTQEIDESLFDFINHLKKINKWDSTYLILVGLNGMSPPERANELPGTNLYNENTQVSLLIKPPTKKRDYGVKWKVDENVSLVDLGTTLLDIFNIKIPSRPDRPAPAVSLQSIIAASNNVFGKSRPLLIESGWSSWRGLANTRYAFQIDQYLVLYDQEIKTFNTLVDRQQLVPIGQNESGVLKILDGIKDFIKVYNLTSWTGLDPVVYRKYRLARQIWKESANESEEEELRILADMQKSKNDIVFWASYLAVEKKDWKELLRLAKKFKDENWEYVAKTNLGQKTKLSVGSCLNVLLLSAEVKNKNCEEPYIQDFKAWLMDKNRTQLAIRELFIRAYRRLLVDRKVLIANLLNGYTWDTVEIGILQPNFVDLFLALPENQKYKTQLSQEL